MPEFTKPVVGSFCWFDVVTNDVLAAKKYFGELFGWSFEDLPMPGGVPYSLSRANGKLVGGMTQLGGDAKKMGAPPHLLSYVAVDNADATVGKVAGFGGKVLMAATDSAQWGRMAIIQDPTGGVCALWQQKQSMGSWLYGETSAMCWNEVLTSDVPKASAFYSKLFGWKTEEMPMPEGGSYTMLKNRGENAAGLMAMPKEMKGETAWACYLQVTSADQTVTRAQKMGGTVLAPPADIEAWGRYAMLQDPQGTVFGIFQPLAKK